MNSTDSPPSRLPRPRELHAGLHQAADRAFLRNVLGFSSVDAGHGWFIFTLPPSEAAVHPAEENGRHELYLLCDDRKAEISALEKKGVQCSKCTKNAGVLSPGSSFPEEALSASISPSTPRHWTCPRDDASRLFRRRGWFRELRVVHGYVRLYIGQRVLLAAAHPSVGPFEGHHYTRHRAIVGEINLGRYAAHR